MRYIDDKTWKDSHTLQSIKAMENRVTGKWTRVQTLEESWTKQMAEGTWKKFHSSVITHIIKRHEFYFATLNMKEEAERLG